MQILTAEDAAAAYANAKATVVQFHVYAGVDEADAASSVSEADKADAGEAGNASSVSDAACVNPAITDKSVNGTFGSGSIWAISDDQIILATNYHVIQPVELNGAICYVVFQNGVIAQPKVLGYDANIDCAFLSVDPDVMTKEQREALRSVVRDDAAAAALSSGSNVFVMHSEEVTREELVSGRVTGILADTSYTGVVTQPSVYVSALTQNMIYCSCYAENGMSGGGTFDEYGHYLGMLTGSTDDGEIVCVLLSDLENVYRTQIEKN